MAAERREQRAGVLVACQPEQARAGQASRIEHVAGSIEQADDADVAGGGGGDLVRQRAADAAESQQHHVGVSLGDGTATANLRELEGGVYSSRRLWRLRARDDKRNVPFRGSLRDGDHVDATAFKGGEHPSRDAWRTGHTLADHRDDRHVRAGGDTVDQALLEFVLERVPQPPHRAVRLRFRDRESNRALGRGLEDGRDRKAFGIDGSERAGGDTVDTDHALAGHGHHGLGGQHGQRLHRITLERLARRDLGARHVRMDERAHVQRDGSAGDGDQRARVQHLGPVVRDLGCLSMMELRNEARVRHHSRIGRENAGDVFPQHHRACAKRSGEQGGREVRSATAERRQAAILGAADVAGHQRDGAGGQHGTDQPSRASASVIQLWRGAAVHIVRAYHVEGIHKSGAALEACDGRRQQQRRHPLPARHHGVLHPWVEVAQHRDGRAQVLVLARQRVDLAGEGAQGRARAEHGVGGANVLAAERQRGLRRALEQHVGDAREGRCHHHERSAMRGDLVRCFLQTAAIRERRAAELPYFELHLMIP